MADPRIAIMGSGRGSNMDAIAGAVRSGRLKAELAVVISDKADAPILAKAKLAGLAAVAVPVPAASSKEQARELHDQAMLATLKSHGVSWVVMAGYMRLVTPGFLAAFRSERGYARVVNVHPSLLPAFPGTGGYAQARAYGAMVAGVTVHLVDDGLDTGPICAQEAFAIGDCESAEEVEARGLVIEHRLYPATLQWVLAEKFTIEPGFGPNLKKGERPRVRPN
jgi:phosphoribosylglycinamide formyltransferase-1